MSAVFAKWHPVTHDFGLIKAPIDQVISALIAWHKSLGIEYSRSEIFSSLSDAFEGLLPLSNSKMRRLFVATQSDWVACFQNGIQGSDPFPGMSYLAGQMGVLAMRVCSTPERAHYPATIWEVYAPQSMGGGALNYRRSIVAMNDGGRWVFEQSGEPYPFENVELYKLPRKRDRFTRELLIAYLKQFGIEPFSDDLFKIRSSSPAIRLQQQTRIVNMPEFTLDEVIAGMPWRTTGR